MKVSYISYLRLVRTHPEATLNQKIIPGDNVEIPPKWASFFEEKEVVEQSRTTDDPELVELGRQRVAARKEKSAAQWEQIKSIQNGDEEENKKSKKNDFVLPLDDVTKSVVDLKIEMKKAGKSKLEIKRAVEELKAELAPVAQSVEQEDDEDKKPRRGRQPKAEVQASSPEAQGRLVKDPVTGQFVRE